MLYIASKKDLIKSIFFLEIDDLSENYRYINLI